MPQDHKNIYLTFDDGPTPEITTWTLDLLKTYNAKATFFCIGNNIEKYPGLFRDLLMAGHTIGNHTFSHPKGWRTSTKNYINGVLKTQDLINKHVSDFNATEVDQSQTSAVPPKDTVKAFTTDQSSRTHLFRPPYGQITPKQGKGLLALGYKIIMWDILAFDWKDSISKEQCAENVISKTRAGSIIVFHDSIKAAPRMKFALAKTLEYFSQQGYQFKGLE